MGVFVRGAPRGSRDDDARGAQQSTVQGVPALDDREHRIGLGCIRGLGCHRLVQVGVERLANGVELDDPGLLHCLGEQSGRGRLALCQRCRIRLAGVLDAQIQAVLHGQQLARKLLERVAMRLLNVALGALADVVELGKDPQLFVLQLFHQRSSHVELFAQRLDVRAGCSHLFWRFTHEISP